MNIVDPGYEFVEKINGEEILKRIEVVGRVCYKSENKISAGSEMLFIKNIIENGHESVLEHEKITVRVICDRGVSHEIVRHRIASYSQESTRYCNYSKEKFRNEIAVIRPCFWNDDSEEFTIWKNAMEQAEKSYFRLIENGASPQEARSVLPNSLKTEIVITMNIREWRHFFKLRTSEKAHPQMREIAIMMLEGFRNEIAVVFDDIAGE